jgi:XTP/dITP diphosphohydrolase
MKKSLIYATGSSIKFLTAKNWLEPLGIDLRQEKVEVAEIQSDNVEEISLDKARKAFEILKQPLIVNDTCWKITALKGFPGVYTRYIYKWFDAQDWLNLLQGHENREIILHQVITYVDQNIYKLFGFDTPGMILPAPQGDPKFGGFDQLVSIVSGKSLAQEHEERGYSIAGEIPLWKEFSNWLLNLSN